MPEQSSEQESSLETKMINKKINMLKDKFLLFLKDKYNILFIVLLVFVLYTRLKYQFVYSIWNDEAVYTWDAYKVLKEPGSFFSYTFLGESALFKILITFFSIFFEPFIAGRVVALLYMVVAVILLYYFSSELFKDKFLALISTGFFIINYIGWLVSIKVLTDIPITMMYLLFAFCLIKTEKAEKKMLWSIATGFSIIAAMLTKQQGILIIFIVLFYFLITKRNFIKDKSALIILIIPLGFLVLGSISFKLLFNYNLIKAFVVYLFNSAGMTDGFTQLSFFLSIIKWPSLLLSLIGAFILIYHRKKECVLLIVWIIIYIGFFEVVIPGGDPRRLLPALPPALILAALTITEIKNVINLSIKKPNLEQIIAFVLLLLIAVSAFPLYKTNDRLIKEKLTTYTGYKEAGDWIKESVPSDAPLFAGSPRTMRLFTEREYYSYKGKVLGGTLWYLRSGEYRANKTLFEHDVNELAQKNDVYLEIDIWEYTQPGWYYPITDKSIEYFNSLGFEIINVVAIRVSDAQYPVIFLMKKQKLK